MAPTSAHHTLSHALQKSLEMPARFKSTLLSYLQITLQPPLKQNLFFTAFPVCLLFLFLFWSSENRFLSFLSDSHALAQCCNVWVAVSTAGECSLLKINHGNISVGIRACRSLGFFKKEECQANFGLALYAFRGTDFWCMSVYMYWHVSVCVCVYMYIHIHTHTPIYVPVTQV